MQGLADGCFLAVVIFMREIGQETEEHSVTYPESFATAAAARDFAYAEALKGRESPF